jgi:hypothetical protein
MTGQTTRADAGSRVGTEPLEAAVDTWSALTLVLLMGLLLASLALAGGV